MNVNHFAWFLRKHSESYELIERIFKEFFSFLYLGYSFQVLLQVFQFDLLWVTEISFKKKSIKFIWALNDSQQSISHMRKFFGSFIDFSDGISEFFIRLCLRKISQNSSDFQGTVNKYLKLSRMIIIDFLGIPKKSYINLYYHKG